MNSSLPKAKSENWDWFLDVGMFFLSQSGFRQCRCWWFSQWSSLQSPSWCSWVNCSPCLRVDSSTSLGCVKSLQVTVEWNNVPLTFLETGPSIFWVQQKQRTVLIEYKSLWVGKKLIGNKIAISYRTIFVALTFVLLKIKMLNAKRPKQTFKQWKNH